MLLKTTRETAGNSSSTSGAARRAGRVSMIPSGSMLSTIGKELKAHAPFTVVGALTGVAIMAVFVTAEVPRSFSAKLFWGLHPLHVLLSTWASLFHMTMALGENVTLLALAVIPAFLFLAVWIPCCTSDIVFPLLFSHEVFRARRSAPQEDGSPAFSGRTHRSRERQAEDVQTKDSRL